MLAENSGLLRKSLIALLRTQPEFEVTGEAKNGKELLDQLKHVPTDIAIIELDLPVMDGKATLDIIRVRFPAVKIIILSNTTNHSLTTDFMSRGASCFLTRACEVETLFNAIKIVSREGYYFDNSISKALLGALIKDKSAIVNDSIEAVFNDRETQILKAICDGKTNKEIASGLHLSTSTIDFYKGKIYAKANCNSVTSLLKYALKKGLVALS